MPLSKLQPQTGPHRWGNYVLGVAAELIALGMPVAGFDASIDGDVPEESGLSSSAALEVATAFFLLKLNGEEMPRLDIAKLCQRAEHRYAGVESGLFDQVTSLFGRSEHAVFFDSRSEEVRTVALPKGLALIIAESGTKRELSAGAYNERRRETRAATEVLGVRALRDVSLVQLEQRGNLPSTLRRRAAHVIEENARVWAALDSLRSGDGPGFGALMNASHESSRKNFDNSTPELDLLVDLARAIPGVLGARLTGAGFGGATVTLCQESKAITAAETLARLYMDKTGIQSQVFVCRIADGAS